MLHPPAENPLVPSVRLAVTTAPPNRVLLLMRHGQSVANAAGAFGGWLDIALTDDGRQQARRAGQLMSDCDVVPTAVHTSALSRAIETASLAVTAAGAKGIVAQHSWRLNERHYGALQGRSRQDAEAEFGAEQVLVWRRSYDVAPPALGAALTTAEASHPRSESLADVRDRLAPYWESTLSLDCARQAVTLVVAHGNSLRVLRMIIENLAPGDLAGLDVPTGVPVRYDLTGNLKPVIPGGVPLAAPGQH